MPDAPEPAAAPPEPSAGAPPLLGPFSLIGVAGGWLTADAFRLGDAGDRGLRWLLTLITPMTAAVLAAWLGGRAGRRPLAFGLSIAGGTMVAGALNGAVIGFAVAAPFGAAFGLVPGLLCALPFVPALLLVSFAARLVARARRGTVVHGADRRGPWVASFAAIAVASLVAIPFAQRYPASLVPALAAFCATTLTVWLAGAFALDVVAWARVARLAGAAVRLRPAGPGAIRPPRGARVVDLGLGDELAEEVIAPAAAYRGVERVVLTVRGAPTRARSALGWAVARSALAVAVSAAAVILHAFSRP
jgi:hypothetical protein